MKYLKMFIDSFRDIGNQEKGWLGIKGHYLGADKQQHVVLGLVFFIIMSFAYSIEKAAAWTVVLGVVKEIFDFFGVTKFLYKIVLGKEISKTGISIADIIATTFIPILIQLIDLYIF